MNYVKEKVEAAKVLFLEILEINEELEEKGVKKEISFELLGGKFPAISVRFWDWRKKEVNIEESFEITLCDWNGTGRRHDLAALSEKVSKWRENFGNS